MWMHGNGLWVTHMPNQNDNSIVVSHATFNNSFRNMHKTIENTKYNVFICRRHSRSFFRFYVSSMWVCVFQAQAIKWKHIQWFSKRKWLLWKSFFPLKHKLLMLPLLLLTLSLLLFAAQQWEVKQKKNIQFVQNKSENQRKYENEDVRCLFKFMPIIKCSNGIFCSSSTSSSSSKVKKNRSKNLLHDSARFLLPLFSALLDVNVNLLHLLSAYLCVFGTRTADASRFSFRVSFIFTPIRLARANYTNMLIDFVQFLFTEWEIVLRKKNHFFALQVSLCDA